MLLSGFHRQFCQAPTTLGHLGQGLALLRTCWLLSGRRRRQQIGQTLVVGTLALALAGLCWLSGRAFPLSTAMAHQVLMILLPLCFTLFLPLCIGWQILHAPQALWDLPDLDWWLTARVPMTFMLIRAGLRLLGSLRGLAILLLALGMLTLAALSLAPWLLLASALVLLYEAGCSTLLALLTTLLLASHFSRGNMRRTLRATAICLCCLPLILLAAAQVPAIGRQIIPAPLVTRIFTPGIWLTSRLLAAESSGSSAVPAPAAPPSTTVLVGLTAMAAAPVLMSIACVLVGRRGYLAGWEELHTAPDSYALQQPSARTALHGGWLWELAWSLPLRPPAAPALIGFCWQDALYDWRRLSSIAVSALFLIIACLRATLGGPLAAPLALAVVLGVDALLARTLGLPALQRLVQARALLQTTPTSAMLVLWSCTLAVGLPVLLSNLILAALTLALVPLDRSLAALFLGSLPICSIGFSLLSVTAGSASMYAGPGQGISRVSALLFFLGGLGLSFSALIPLSKAAFVRLDPATQRIVLALLQTIIHVPAPFTPLLHALLFEGLPCGETLFVSSVLLYSAFSLRKALGPLV